jgi:hypothetical protein
MRRKVSRGVHYRSVTALSLPDSVGIVQDLQDHFSDLEAADRQEREGGMAHIWFRGHSDKGWHLTPKIFRTGNGIGVEDEKELYEEFVRRGCSSVPSLASDWALTL